MTIVSSWQLDRPDSAPAPAPADHQPDCDRTASEATAAAGQSIPQVQVTSGCDPFISEGRMLHKNAGESNARANLLLGEWLDRGFSREPALSFAVVSSWFKQPVTGHAPAGTSPGHLCQLHGFFKEFVRRRPADAARLASAGAADLTGFQDIKTVADFRAVRGKMEEAAKALDPADERLLAMQSAIERLDTDIFSLGLPRSLALPRLAELRQRIAACTGRRADPVDPVAAWALRAARQLKDWTPVARQQAVAALARQVLDDSECKLLAGALEAAVPCPANRRMDGCEPASTSAPRSIGFRESTMATQRAHGRGTRAGATRKRKPAGA